MPYFAHKGNHTVMSVHFLTPLLIYSDACRLLNVKKDELDQKLANYNLREIRQTSRNTKSLPSIPDIKIDVLEVTLIAMGAAVLLGAIVAVVCIFLSRLKHKYEP